MKQISHANYSEKNETAVILSGTTITSQKPYLILQTYFRHLNDFTSKKTQSLSEGKLITEVRPDLLLIS